jgi:glycosyltransferase involved in cell wall biosynthesis
MKIMLAAKHRYPAGGVGCGCRVNPRATGGASLVHDTLARGLAELGHEVFYVLQGGFDGPPPEGIRFCDRPVRDAQVMHYYNSQFLHSAWPVHVAAGLGMPWISSCHRDSTGLERPFSGPVGRRIPANWVAVSRTLAEFHLTTRWVHNGIDPAELIFSTTKEDYFLFVCRAESAEAKGLRIALAISRSVGIELVVAGGSFSEVALRRVGELCREHGARHVGEVRGRQKAELFAGARALLFPTQLNEAFGLVIAEALMSGTPVITSRRGACPELITPEVGFDCETPEEYECAARHVSDIDPHACRDLAMDRYHYHRMASDFVREYEREIAAPSVRPLVGLVGRVRPAGAAEPANRRESVR